MSARSTLRRAASDSGPSSATAASAEARNGALISTKTSLSVRANDGRGAYNELKTANGTCRSQNAVDSALPMRRNLDRRSPAARSARTMSTPTLGKTVRPHWGRQNASLSLDQVSRLLDMHNRTPFTSAVMQQTQTAISIHRISSPSSGQAVVFVAFADIWPNRRALSPAGRG